MDLKYMQLAHVLHSTSAMKRHTQTQKRLFSTTVNAGKLFHSCRLQTIKRCDFYTAVPELSEIIGRQNE